MENMSKHIPVLVSEVIALLNPKSSGKYLDGTFGGGGHSKALLEASAPEGKVFALDRDPSAEIFASDLRREYPKRFKFNPISFSQAESVGVKFDGALLDLGMSTNQLQSSYRGFSFEKKEPLDLRFDDSSGQTASQFLNQSSYVAIERVFREYAQDRYAKKLAARIVNERRTRPIRTTKDFLEYVGTDNPKVLAPLFQALRIQVNDEFAELNKGLAAVLSCLKPNGVLAVISFHSLEDRIVKNFLREAHGEILTNKPIVPSDEEVKENRASRSAKLRAIRR